MFHCFPPFYSFVEHKNSSLKKGRVYLPRYHPNLHIVEINSICIRGFWQRITTFTCSFVTGDAGRTYGTFGLATSRDDFRLRAERLAFSKSPTLWETVPITTRSRQ
ncbi:hypothetical protein CW304_15115 [Bacillus sp. UFRGS-B20]|nr:hypothetical protein CW304_15115 [Bacillus sp. UFRGS-B20]